MLRTDLSKFSYDLARTRIEFSDLKDRWEVTTIDLQKFNQTLPENFAQLLNESLQESRPHSASPLYATMVYQVEELQDPEKSTAQSLVNMRKKNKLFFHQAYETTEEAFFGHEELVQSILTGQFYFLEEQFEKDEVSNYLLYPEIGEVFEGKPYHLLPFGIFNIDDDDDDDEDDWGNDPEINNL